MKLDLFKTLWGHDGDIDSAIALTLAADFQGIEAPLPADHESASHFLAALSNRVLELTPEGIHKYDGGYTEYVARTGYEAPGLRS